MKKLIKHLKQVFTFKRKSAYNAYQKGWDDYNDFFNGSDDLDDSDDMEYSEALTYYYNKSGFRSDVDLDHYCTGWSNGKDSFVKQVEDHL